MDWRNGDFANLKNSLIELTTALKVTRRRSKRTRKSHGPSREEAVESVQTDLKSVIENPLNTTPRPTYNFDAKAVGSFRRLYRQLKELRNKSNPSEEDIKATEEALRVLVRSLDPNHPFIDPRGKNQEILFGRDWSNLHV